MNSASAAPIRVALLGPPKVVNADGATMLGPGKPLAVLAYTLLATRKTVTRDRLQDLLWADADPGRARHSLRQALSTLRQLFGDIIDSKADTVSICDAVHSDYDEFQRALREGRDGDAIAMYGGAFMSEFALPGDVEFDQWVQSERLYLRRLLLEACEREVAGLQRRGDLAAAAAIARFARDELEDNEAAWRLLFDALAMVGESRSLGIEAERLRARMRNDEASLEPSTEALIARAMKVADPTRESDPLARGECVGREAQFGRLVSAWHRVRDGGPMVTVCISAEPGIGKTRLLAEFRTRLRRTRARSVLVRAVFEQREERASFAAALIAELARLPGASGISTVSAGTLVALAPSVASVLRAVTTPSPDHDAAHRRADAIVDLADAVAAEGPVAILIDDAQWIDPASLALVATLVSRLSSVPLLLVLAHREAPSIQDFGDAVTLPPLTQSDVEQFLAGSGQIDPGVEPWATLARTLFDATAGSPLLMTQGVRELLTTGALIETAPSGAWSMPDAPRALDVASHAGSLSHRLSQLTTTAQRVLQIVGLAGSCRSDDASLEDELSALEKAGLVTRAGSDCGCAHDLIRERAIARPITDDDRAWFRERTYQWLASDREGDVRNAGRVATLTGDGAGAAVAFRQWSATQRASGDRRAPGELSRDFFAGVAEPREVRAFLAAERARAMRRRIIIPVVAVAVLMIVARAVRSGRPDAQLHVLDPLTAPAATVHLELRDASGGRVHDSNDTVLAMATGPNVRLADDTLESIEDGKATFSHLRIVGTGPTTVRFISRRHGSVESDSAYVGWTALPPPTLWIADAKLDGVPLSRDSITSITPHTDSLLLTLTIRYSRADAPATLLLAGALSWLPRRQGCTTFGAIRTPARDVQTSTMAKLPAPRAAGIYRIVLTHWTEGSGEYVCSGTNWLRGRPVWNDGNDLIDITADSLAAARSRGWTTWKWLYENPRRQVVVQLPVAQLSFRVTPLRQPR